MEVNKINYLSHDESSLLLISGNINHLMHQHNVDTATFNKNTGIGASTINALRKGTGNPTLSTLLTIAHFFDVEIGGLIGVDLTIKSNKTSMAFEMPLIKMGEVFRFLEQQLTIYNTYTAEIDTAHSKRYFAVSLSNDSLAPHFGMGTVFIICRDEIVEDGDIVLVTIGGHPPCFRKVFIDGSSHAFLPIFTHKDENIVIHEEYKIIGIVVKSIRTFSEK